MLCGTRPDQTELNLSKQGLKESHVVLLAADMSLIASLTHLDLGGNEIGLQGARAVAAAVCNSVSLVSVIVEASLSIPVQQLRATDNDNATHADDEGDQQPHDPTNGIIRPIKPALNLSGR